MRAGPSDAQVAGALSWQPLASSWDSVGNLLADQIPISSGQLTADVTLAVPERLTFQVPSWAGGMSWIPTGFDHPLAKFGQQINLSILVSAPVSGLQWVVPIGWFPIQGWDYDDGSDSGFVDVECVGILQLPNDDTFTTPVVPRSSDTFISMLTRLMSNGVPINFDPALVDRPLPQSFQWDVDTSRLSAIYDVIDAWPARVRTDQYGTVQFLPILVDPPSVILTLKDGPKGTLLGAPVSDTRNGIYNVYPVAGSLTDDPSLAPVTSVAQVSAGPLSTSTYGRVVAPTFSSPLITNQAQADAAAVAKLQQSLRGSLNRAARIMPDPRVDIDDAVQVLQNPQGLQDTLVTRGYVNGYTLPLVVTDGAMTVNVGSEIWS